MMNSETSEIRKYYNQKLPTFTQEQWDIFSYVVNLLDDKHFRMKNTTAILVDGVAGTGKTEIVKAICDFVDKKRTSKTGTFVHGNAIYVGSTSVVALNHKNGQTAHSAFGFPSDLKDDESCWEPTEWNAKQIKEANVIVYDEVSVVDKRYIHMLDRGLKELMECGRLFGGKIIIFVGNFRALAPVFDSKGKTGTPINKDIKRKTLDSSPISVIWTQLKRFFLTTVHKAYIDYNNVHAQFLDDVGMGLLEGKTTGHPDVKLVQLPETISYTCDMIDLINFIYPEGVLVGTKLFAEKTILTARYREAKEINDIILKHYHPGEGVHCLSEDSEEILDQDEAYLENLHEHNEFPDQDLQLNTKCLCMIIRSMDKPNKLMIGEKVLVLDVTENTVTVKKLDKASTTTYDLRRQMFQATVYSNGKEILLKRNQFPLRVCYAMTIHKSQGQHYDIVGIDLRIPRYAGFSTAIFCHGQLYQALSRVRGAKDMKVLVDESAVVNEVAHTHNIVHPEIVHKYKQ